MIKIKYPTNLTNFQDDYLTIFDDSFLNSSFCGKRVKDILLMSIEDIIEFKNTNIDYNSNQDINTKREFKYDIYQKKIAELFMKYQKEMNLNSCYFCNINYIYSFENKYCDEIEFVRYASKSELSNVNGITIETAKLIVEYRNENNITSLDDMTFLNTRRQNSIKNRGNNSYNHFTLDHIIEKSSHPLFALSLYNLIPSCSVCNSKYKGTIELVKNSNDLKFIPSYKNNSFNNEVKFKLYFDDGCSVEESINLNKIKIVLKSDDVVYRKYISTFKLYSRYQEHSPIAIDLIEKSQKYSYTKINQMARIVSKPVLEIKKDIFGREIFEGDLGKVPLTKLKRDICKSVGVL